MAYVYRHIRLDKNEPFYIGISATDDNYARAFDRSHKHIRNKLWQNITNKKEFFGLDFKHKHEEAFVQVKSPPGTLYETTKFVKKQDPAPSFYRGSGKIYEIRTDPDPQHCC